MNKFELILNLRQSIIFTAYTIENSMNWKNFDYCRYHQGPYYSFCESSIEIDVIVVKKTYAFLNFVEKCKIIVKKRKLMLL